MRGGVLGGNPHHLGAPPCYRAQIGVLEPAGPEHLPLGGLKPLGREGDFHPHDPGGVQQPLRVRPRTEDMPAVDPLALEDGTGVMQPVGQDVQPRLAPRNQSAIQPNRTVTVVVRKQVHRHRGFLLMPRTLYYSRPTIAAYGKTVDE